MDETFNDKLRALIRDEMRDGANKVALLDDLDNAWHDLFHGDFDLEEGV